MTKEEKVIKYYMICNKLKSLIRSGWIKWNLEGDRLESVAEHIYGVQMLAISMWSEYKYDIDLEKVILMLAVHELEETVIGDLTIFDIEKSDKIKLGHEAVCNILSDLRCGDKIKNLIFEFDDRKTKEALFAYYCDKLECDIQAKIYDDRGYVSLRKQDNNKVFKDKDVKKYLDEYKSFSGMWLKFGQDKYNYDNNFKEVSDYLLNNDIKDMLN